MTLTGGKWTTYRKMGEDTVDYFTQITGQTLNPSKSLNQKIHGFTTEIPSGHWSIYGSDATKIQQLAKEKSEWSQPIHPAFPNILAEVVWSCQNEMAIKVEDVLSRRIRMLILDAQAALDSAEKVAQTMAVALQKDQAWIDSELADFNKTGEKYLIKST